MAVRVYLIVAGGERRYQRVVNEERGGPVPDKSPRKPSAKKPPDRSLKEKRQDKKGKKATGNLFGA